MTATKARIPSKFIVKVSKNDPALGGKNPHPDALLSKKGRTAIITELETSNTPGLERLKLKAMPDNILAKVLIEVWSVDFVERAFERKWAGPPVLRKRFK